MQSTFEFYVMIKLLANIFYVLLISSYLSLSYWTLFHNELKYPNHKPKQLQQSNEFGKKNTEIITVQRRHIYSNVKYFPNVQFDNPHVKITFNEYSSHINLVQNNKTNKFLNPSQLNFRGPPLL